MTGLDLGSVFPEYKLIQKKKKKPIVGAMDPNRGPVFEPANILSLQNGDGLHLKFCMLNSTTFATTVNVA